MPKPDPAIKYDLKLVKKHDRALVRAVKQLRKVLDPDLELQPLVDCNIEVNGVAYHTEVTPLHCEYIQELAKKYPKDSAKFEKNLHPLIVAIFKDAEGALKQLGDYLASKEEKQKDERFLQVGACYFTDGTCENNWSKAGCLGHPNHDHWDSNPCPKPRPEGG
jgi:hypothetical protein